MLVGRASEGRVTCVGNHTPLIISRGIIVLPTAACKAGEMCDHLKGGIIMDVTAPWVARTDQLLVRILNALIETADCRLENIMGSARRDKGIGQAVCQGQRALIAADGPGSVALLLVRSLVLMQLGIAKCRAPLTIPDLLVVDVCHPHIVVRGIGAIVEANDIDRPVEIVILAHGRDNVQTLILVRGDDTDIAIGLPGLLRKVGWELVLLRRPLCIPLDEVPVWIAGLIGIRIHKIHDIAVFLVSIIDRLPVPLVHGLISSALAILVPLLANPVGHPPAKDTDLNLWIQLLGICGHNKSRRARDIHLLIFLTHGTCLCSCRIIPVIAHFHLDMGKEGTLTSEEILHHLPVLLGTFCLVV